MSPRSSSARSDPAPRPDEFEWPPKTDGLSVYEIGPDPWQGLQAASHEVFVSHHSEASPPPAIEDDRLSRRRLAGVITATVIVIGVTSWVLYGALTRPAPIETIHHPAASYPAPASVPPPPRITIVATYPVDGATTASTTTPAATPTTPAAAPRMPVALASAEALAAVVPMSAHVPAPTAVARWVVELWVDPAWHTESQSADPLPSSGPPRTVVLTSRSALVGRPSTSRNIHPDVDCAEDTGVSRRHAQLTTDGTRFWVEDLESANGTFVATSGGPLPKDPIPVGSKRELDADDRVYVGAWTRLVVRPATEDEQD